MALRQTVLALVSDKAIPSDSKTQEKIDSHVPASHVRDASLVFKEHLERISELLLILLIGGTLFLDSWSWLAVGFALFLFAVARPISFAVSLIGTRSPKHILGMAGWFGVRGIGSLYYLMYAIQPELLEELALELIRISLVVVVLSIFVHGISVKPMMSHFWRRNPD